MVRVLDFRGGLYSSPYSSATRVVCSDKHTCRCIKLYTLVLAKQRCPIIA